MRIAVASGKGGTGKTTIATNLAYVLATHESPVAYLDCDVEEPNGHLFLRPEIERRMAVSIPVPQVEAAACRTMRPDGRACRACSEVCRYSAILSLGKQVLTFPKLCHGCGGCALVCPDLAIREVQRRIGVLELGRTAQGVLFGMGRLDIGEAMSPPVIRAVLQAAPRDGTVIVDAPPGTSCPVIESVKGADAVLLVTEPTPFGLSDLRLAVAMVRALGLPLGVAVNRVGVGDHQVFEYCRGEGIPVLLEIADDRRLAEAYSRGELFAETDPGFAGQLGALYQELGTLARGPRPAPAPPPTSPQLGGPAPRPPSELSPRPSGNGLRELVVISGKGGTGKTSIVASFFAMAQRAALADCDVDAADLHLVVDPQVQKEWAFSGKHEARIDTEACIGCGMCERACRFGAIRLVETQAFFLFEVDSISCEGCGVCAIVCPTRAIEMIPADSGRWFVSDTRLGPLTHARLGIAQENSGKLVSLVRREAQSLAAQRQRDLLMCDGAPGTGCPVIASITGARLVLIVTEPTCSGWHDMRRVVELTRHFGIETAVCVNKADINPELAERICRESEALSVPVLGRVRYDEAVTRAQVEGRPVVEDGESPAAQDIRQLWQRIRDALHKERREE